MMNLHFEALDPIKLPIVQRFYKQYYPGTKAKKNEHIVIARLDQSVCAAVRFRPVEQYRLLTGMAVASNLRNQGIGHQLLHHCEQTCLKEDVYCFAFSELEDFYQAHHFRQIREEALPNCLKVLLQRYRNGGKTLTPMHYVTDIAHI